jgi:transcriptional regulator with XRE-family HTH domain
VQIAMPKESRDSFAVEVGRRLAAARAAAGFSQADFARRLRVPVANLSNWENGWAMVPPHYISKLFQMLRVDSNYLYLDDPSGLPHDLYEKMFPPQDINKSA